jgi:hypothetical protein
MATNTNENLQAFSQTLALWPSFLPFWFGFHRTCAA